MENDTKNKSGPEREESQTNPQPEAYSGYNPTPFKYKAVAALILIVPFGFLIEWGQNVFLSIEWEYISKMTWEYISKMTVLTGLILYIVAVGKAAKKIQDWHEGRNTD